MSNNPNKNNVEDNFRKKEKIFFSLFTKKELNIIDNLINEDNYIIDYLWNFLDVKIDCFLQNHKNNKNFTNNEVISIFNEYSDIIRDYINNHELQDSEKTAECK